MTAGTTLIGKGLHTCWKAGAFAGPSTGRAREAWGRWEACGGAWGGAWGRGEGHREGVESVGGMGRVKGKVWGVSGGVGRVMGKVWGGVGRVTGKVWGVWGAGEGRGGDAMVLVF